MALQISRQKSDVAWHDVSVSIELMRSGIVWHLGCKKLLLLHSRLWPIGSQTPYIRSWSSEFIRVKSLTPLELKLLTKMSSSYAHKDWKAQHYKNKTKTDCLTTFSWYLSQAEKIDMDIAKIHVANMFHLPIKLWDPTASRTPKLFTQIDS